MIEPSHIAGRIFETIKERLHCVAMYRISKQFERYAEAPSDLFLAAIHPTPDKRIRFDISETTNLASQFPDQVEQLQAIHEGYLSELGD